MGSWLPNCQLPSPGICSTSDLNGNLKAPVCLRRPRLILRWFRRLSSDGGRGVLRSGRAALVPSCPTRHRDQPRPPDQTVKHRWSWCLPSLWRFLHISLLHGLLVSSLSSLLQFSLESLDENRCYWQCSRWWYCQSHCIVESVLCRVCPRGFLTSNNLIK